MTTTKPRQSRASRGADKAAEDQDQPQPEPQPAEDEDEREDEDEEGEDQPTEPEPGISIEPVPVTYYRPTVSLPKGYQGAPEARTVTCEHPYLHETEKSAAACGRRIAARGTFVK